MKLRSKRLWSLLLGLTLALGIMSWMNLTAYATTYEAGTEFTFGQMQIGDIYEAGVVIHSDDCGCTTVLYLYNDEDLEEELVPGDWITYTTPCKVIVTDLKSVSILGITAYGITLRRFTPADEVVEMINALPEAESITLSNKEEIEAARAAYNALTDDRKETFSTTALERLTDAEARLAILLAMSEVSARTGSDVAYTGHPIQLINTPVTKLPEGCSMKYAVTTEDTATAPADESLYTTSIPAATELGTYYVWYKVAGGDDYNDTTPSRVSVTVVKADPAVVPPSGLTAILGQTLADLVLTNPDSNIEGIWVWVDAPTTSVGESGEKTFKADFTPADTVHYNSLKNVDVKVTVGKINPIATPPAGLTATYGQTLKDVTLENPDGNTEGDWSWEDNSASVGNVGIHTHWATFTPVDGIKYKNKTKVKVTVTVLKADNPATVKTAATVKRGGNTIDLADNIDMKSATGAVRYAISGSRNGCTLNGSLLTSGPDTGSIIVNVSIAGEDNYFTLAATPIEVTIIDKSTQKITAPNVTMTYGDKNKRIKAATNGDGKISYAVRKGSKDYIDVDASTGALTVRKLPKDGKAYVTVTAAETADYAKATKVVTVTIKKQKKTLNSKKTALQMNKGLRVRQEGSSIAIQWGKTSGISMFKIYGGYSGKDTTLQKTIKDSNATETTLKKLNGKKLNLKKKYKFYIIAYQNINGEPVQIAKSLTVTIVGRKNTKATNVKSIKGKGTYTLHQGDTVTIKSSLVRENRKKKLLPKDYDKKLRYVSSDETIAKVDKDGKIRAGRIGLCSIYIFAHNGYMKKIKVSVN